MHDFQIHVFCTLICEEIIRSINSNKSILFLINCLIWAQLLGDNATRELGRNERWQCKSRKALFDFCKILLSCGLDQS